MDMTLCPIKLSYSWQNTPNYSMQWEYIAKQHDCGTSTHDHTVCTERLLWNVPTHDKIPHKTRESKKIYRHVTGSASYSFASLLE